MIPKVYDITRPELRIFTSVIAKMTFSSPYIKKLPVHTLREKSLGKSLTVLTFKTNDLFSCVFSRTCKRPSR